jgi:hypothetical protein
VSARWRSALAFLWAAFVGAIFGVLVRFAGSIPFLNTASHASVVMTVSYLIAAPLSIGFVSAISMQAERPPLASTIGAAWLATLLGIAICMLLLLEGAICAVFMLPIALVLSTIGGLLGWLARGSIARHRRSTALCVALLPLLLPQLEVLASTPSETRIVQTEIRIHAQPEIIWKNIFRVTAIRRAELPPSWTQMIGFPRPVEATLSREGIGGVRHATFEHGLLFLETVTGWEPDRLLAFTIKADTEHIPPTTLDRHVTIGGPYFDVLTGEYRIESIAPNEAILHLTSRERLSTNFNGYAALWTDAVMRSIQKSILVVIKNRCEAASH